MLKLFVMYDLNQFEIKMNFEEFWYIISSALAFLLSAIIWHYIRKNEKTLENINNVLQELKIITKLHEKELNNHEKRISDIEEVLE
ncbi:MAG: hypothetical protein KatS3mg031_2945 [Chitinophagales bacterium]|nr:MAG: hypothetical protein KatS3mg031_2945 [Chitinophagales bacterium]